MKKKENKGNYFSDFFISIRSYRPEGAAKHAYNIDHPLKLAIATWKQYKIHVILFFFY